MSETKYNDKGEQEREEAAKTFYIFKVIDYTTTLVGQMSEDGNKYYVQRGDGTKYEYWADQLEWSEPISNIIKQCVDREAKQLKQKVKELESVLQFGGVDKVLEQLQQLKAENERLDKHNTKWSVEGSIQVIEIQISPFEGDLASRIAQPKEDK